jgi:hypothetical protein
MVMDSHFNSQGKQLFKLSKENRYALLAQICSKEDDKDGNISADEK